jgi:hypothetical protein
MVIEAVNVKRKYDSNQMRRAGEENSITHHGELVDVERKLQRYRHRMWYQKNLWMGNCTLIGTFRGSSLQLA